MSLLSIDSNPPIQVDLPFFDLGGSRFATQHRALVISRMRAHGQPIQPISALRRSGSRGLGVSLAQLQKDGVAMWGITILDVWAAQMLQARWKGVKT